MTARSFNNIKRAVLTLAVPVILAVLVVLATPLNRQAAYAAANADAEQVQLSAAVIEGEWDIFYTDDPQSSAAAASGAAGSTADADTSPAGDENDDSNNSGRFFVTKTHIIISCVVAFGIAVAIAVFQAKKRFK